MAFNIELLKQLKLPYNVLTQIGNSTNLVNPRNILNLGGGGSTYGMQEPAEWAHTLYELFQLSYAAFSAGNPVTNIYSANGSLSANRTITLANRNLTFAGNDVEVFTISKPAVFRVVDAAAIDFTGDGLVFDLNDYVDFRVGSNRMYLDSTGLKLTLFGDLQINSDSGVAGYVLMSNGAGFSPTWSILPGASTIYNSDANLLGDRVVSMNTFNLSFTGSSTEQFNISGMVSASLQATTLTLTTGVGAGIQMAQHINLLLDPTSELRLNGSGGLAGQAIVSNGAGLTPAWKAVSKINGVETSINYNAEDGDVVYGTVGAGGITVTLPDATGKDNMRVVVKQVDAGVGSLGINTAGGNLEGVAFPMLVPGTMQGFQFTSNGGHWWVTGAF